MIVQNVSAEGATDISFTLPKTDLPQRSRFSRSLRRRSPRRASSTTPTSQGVPHRCRNEEPSRCRRGHVEALGEAGINIEIISTSSIRVSCVVRATEVERAVQAVHDRSAAMRRSASVPEPRIAVVGATGDVGGVR